MKRLAIITTHPIQYYAPIFMLIHKRRQIAIKVFYTWGEGALNKYDPGFQKTIQWDVPLLEGYPFEWARNISANSGSHHYKGIITPDLNKQIENWKPEAILIFGWAYKGHLSVIRYFAGKIPIWFRGDSTLLDGVSPIKSAIKKIFLRRLYRKIDCAFYVGTNNKAYYNAYGLRDDRLIFAPHAIDNDKFSAKYYKEPFDLRNSLGLYTDDILILFAGKFEEKKGPLLLIDAFKKLRKVNLHLLFVGDGALEGELKRKANGDQRIYFMNFQNQSVMPVIYQAVDLFCLPSKGPGETWGLAVNEAMASGKAVLVSDKVGCAVDLIKTDYNGAIFKSEDLADLANKLHMLTRSKALLNSYGQNSKTLIKDWNFLRIAEAIENKLNETIRSD